MQQQIRANSEKNTLKSCNVCFFVCQGDYRRFLNALKPQGGPKKLCTIMGKTDASPLPTHRLQGDYERFFMPWKSRACRKTLEFALQLIRPWRFGAGTLELGTLKSVAKAVYHRGKTNFNASPLPTHRIILCKTRA